MVVFGSIADDLRGVDTPLARVFDGWDDVVGANTRLAAVTGGSEGVFSSAHLIIALLRIVHPTEHRLIPLRLEMQIRLYFKNSNLGGL